MNEPGAIQIRNGMIVVSADGVAIGPVEADADTHLRVRVAHGDAPAGQIWIPKAMVQGVEGSAVHLNRVRADLHEAVLSMPPGQQREFATLAITLNVGRTRGLRREGTPEVSLNDEPRRNC